MAAKRDRSIAMLLCLWVALAMVLGGGGSPNPASETALQLATGGIFIGCIWLGAFNRLQDFGPPKALLMIAGLLLALPVLQLVPMPPALWQNLPGRQMEAASLDLIGRGDTWMPFSIAPHLTLAGLLALVLPLILALLVSMQGLETRRWILSTIAVVALASVLLGALQLVGGETAFRLYPDAHPVWLTGFHANRNAAADALLVAMLAASAWYASGAGRARYKSIVYIALALLFAGAVLTGSRAGIALLLPTLIAVAVILRGSVSPRLTRVSGLFVACIAVMAIFALVVIGSSNRIHAVADRFTAGGEFRPELWRDSWTTLTANWPWGTGIGTFVPAFLPHERFEVIDATMPNRAHSEYLEFLIEAGLPGLAIGLVVIGLIASLALRSWRDADQPRAMSIFSVTTLILISLHGLIDYPLRNMAIASLAGVALGMLGPLPSAKRRTAVAPGEGLGSQVTESSGK